MSDAVAVLHALAQGLAVTNLYSPGHPATRLSADNLWKALEKLFESDPQPIFLFLGSAPVYGGRALHELREWQNSARLARGGVQRLQFNREALTRESLAETLQRLSARVAAGAAPPEPFAEIAGVAFGTVTVQEQEQIEAIESTPAEAVEGAEAPDFPVDLSDELDVMRYVYGEARRGAVARAEVEAVARIIGSVHDAHPTAQVSYGDEADYRVIHPVNTAFLAIEAATLAGVEAASRHRLAVIALVHDIGMARIDPELGRRAGLTEAERAVVESHTTQGGDLLLSQGGRGFELASVVAFEHHLRPDGTGYPARRFHPASHWASRLVGCCATFTALRAPRPFRGPWPLDRAVRYVEDGAATVFDAEAAHLVASALRNR